MSHAHRGSGGGGGGGGVSPPWHSGRAQEPVLPHLVLLSVGSQSASVVLGAAALPLAGCGAKAHSGELSGREFCPFPFLGCFLSLSSFEPPCRPPSWCMLAKGDARPSKKGPYEYFSGESRILKCLALCTLGSELCSCMGVTVSPVFWQRWLMQSFRK